MEELSLFTSNDLAKLQNHRSGEIKLRKMITVPKNTDTIEFFKTCEAKYVLFGIPEDIGVRANFGSNDANRTKHKILYVCLLIRSFSDLFFEKRF